MIKQTILSGIVVDESAEFTLDELSRACDVSEQWLVALIEQGVLEPLGEDQAQWRFEGICLKRARIARRLETDLGVNLAGAALALELLEEVEELRKRIAVLERSI